MGSERYADSSSFETFFSAVGNFLVMFSGSAAIGIVFALISALISYLSKPTFIQIKINTKEMIIILIIRY